MTLRELALKAPEEPYDFYEGENETGVEYVPEAASNFYYAARKQIPALLDMVEQMGEALVMAKKSLKRAPFNTHRAMDDAIKAYDDFMKE